MTSENIYSHTCNDRTPYTYLIGWTHFNKWYYGVRYGKGCHPEDLWVKYFTSSPIVKNTRTMFGEPDVIQVRKIFSDKNYALLWEKTVLRRMKVHTNNKMLNAHWGGGTTSEIVSKKMFKDTIVAYDTQCDVFKRVSKYDPRIDKNELIPSWKFAKSQKGKSKNLTVAQRARASKNKQNMVVSMNVNTKEIHYVTKDVFDKDTELVGINNGKSYKHSKKRCQEHSSKLSDIHKDRVSAFDKELNKNVVITKEEFDTNSNRYVGITKGMFVGKDIHGYKYYISNTDPRYISGEIVHHRSKKFD